MPVISDSLNLRVILAGKTGLEATLRKDPGIELIRARTALEALGELSEPIDAESPDRTVVIVGTDVAKTVVSRELTAAIKVLRPDTTTLLAIEGGGQDPSFDGTIPPGSDHVALRSVLSGKTAPTAARQPAKPAKPEPHAPIQTQWEEIELPEMPAPTPPPVPMPSPTPVAPAASRSPVLPQMPRVTQQVMFIGEASSTSPVGGMESQLLDVPARIVPGYREPRPETAGDPLPPPLPAPVVTPAAHAWLNQQPAATSSPTASTPVPPPLPSVRTPTPAPVRSTGAWSWADDRAMIHALLNDHDVIEAGLDIIRKRLERADVAYHPLGSPHIAVGAPVTFEGKHLGHLTSLTASPSELTEPGKWLGHWITLQAQLRDSRRAAITDELTGAFNRRYLDRFLESAVQTSAAKRHMLTVMTFDIDHFKGFNDRYGHAAGDEILTETVRLLRSVIRPDDRVCRVGGDEFVVVFFEPTGPREAGTRHPATVEQICERFRKQIAEHRFPRLGSEAAGRLTISAGLATFPWDGRTGRDLLLAADANLLKAKRDGRNAIVVGG